MKQKVLVVDDDDSVRESLKKILQGAGYDVVLAAGGLEAALRIEPGQIDLLLLDLNLPNQSGWDVFGQLTRRQPFVPVIIITGMPNQYRTALAAGAGALFEKPVEVPVLLKTMEELLAEPNEVRLLRLSGQLPDTRYEPPAKGVAGENGLGNSAQTTGRRPGQAAKPELNEARYENQTQDARHACEGNAK